MRLQRVESAAHGHPGSRLGTGRVGALRADHSLARVCCHSLEGRALWESETAVKLL